MFLSQVEPEPRKKRRTTITVNLSAQEALDACVEMVTVNGRPFSCLKDSGFRKILDPVLTSLNKASAGPTVTVNRQTISQLITSKAKKLRDQIRAEVAGKLVSLKADTCKRIDRHLMGVNIQLVKNCKLCLRNLGIREFHRNHTGENMKREILGILEKFGLGVKGLYSCTADNAANIQKTNELIDKEARRGYAGEEELDCECFYVSAMFDGYEERHSSGSFSDERRESPDAEKEKKVHRLRCRQCCWFRKP